MAAAAMAAAPNRSWSAEICSTVLQRVLNPDVDGEERRVLKLVVPLAAVGGCVLTLTAALHAASAARWSGDEGNTVQPGQRGERVPTLALVGDSVSAVSTAALVLCTLKNGRLNSKWLDCALCVLALGVVLTDWGSAVRGEGEYWPLGISILDSLVAFQSPSIVRHFVLTVFVLWAVLRSIEDMMRLGLWSAPYSSGVAHPAICDTSPDVVLAVAHMCVSRLCPFLLSFAVTTSVVGSLRRSESVAQNMAELLGRYDLDGARDLLFSATAREMNNGTRQALLRLLRNLSVYKPFLPQSCLPVDADWGRDGTTGEEQRVSVSPPPSMAQTPRGAMSASPQSNGGLNASALTNELVLQSFHTGRRSSNTTAHSGRSGLSLGTVGHQRSERMMSPLDSALFRPQSLGSLSAGEPDPLRRRNVSLVCMNMRGYLHTVGVLTTVELAELHKVLISKVTARVHLSRGLTDSLKGDRICASINGARPSPGHKMSSVRLAWDTTSPSFVQIPRLGSFEREPRKIPTMLGARRSSTEANSAAAVLEEAVSTNQQQGDHEMSLHVGVASGEMLCGVLGSDQLRRYSHIGHTVAWSHALERLATRFRIAVLANSTTKSDTEMQFYYKVVDHAVMGKKSHPGVVEGLWSVAGKHEDRGEEWMYELAERVRCDPWKTFNEAKTAALRGDKDAAMDLCRQGRAEAPVLGGTFDQLQEEISTRHDGAVSVIHEVYLARNAGQVPPPQQQQSGLPMRGAAGSSGRHAPTVVTSTTATHSSVESGE
eukprot:TRINITY_DN15494_c0_g1_i1.p1 TRINITY_DN15494_c0_g1~~TRINITY_DN15494_c0_g1_i1.p1  ORF type:complete len:792 (+),score=149.60 TRINITY_DN15494_c0_g1_i1:72-2378(+)